MACWAQAFNSYFCEASDVYMDECYDYPWRPLIHSTGYSDDGKPIPITREAAAKAITNHQILEQNKELNDAPGWCV